MAFDINAQVMLSGAKNVQKVRNSIQKQLTGISVPVSLKIDKNSASTLKSFNGELNKLNSNLAAISKNGRTAASALSNVSRAVNVSSRSADQLSKATTQASSSLATTAKQAKAAGSEIEAFGKDAALAIRRFSAFTIATGAIFGFVRSVQNATKEAVAFEREIARVVQVTGASEKGINGLKSTIDGLSTSLGISANELAATAVTLAQTGQTIDEVRDSLKAISRATLAPTFGDLKSTTEGVIAALNQFNIQADRTEAVLGSLNAVSKNFAVESEDLISVIRRAGGVFATAAGDIQKPEEALAELVGIFTAVRSTTRETADTIATGLRTIFSRIQRRSTIDFLKKFNIELVDSNNKFVGFFEAFKRISAGLEDLQKKGDSVTIAGVVEELGGIRQIGKILPAIQQFAKAEEARRVALAGTASISKDVAIATQTLSVQVQNLQQKFQKLIRDISDSDTFQNLARFALSTADAFITLADTLRPVLPLLTTIASVKIAGAAFEFTKGFVGGIKRGGAGGGSVSGGLGSAIGKAASGNAVSSNAKLVQAQNENTTAVLANTNSMGTLNASMKTLESSTLRLNSTSSTIASSLPALLSALRTSTAKSSVGGSFSRPPRRRSSGGSIQRFATGGSVRMNNGGLTSEEESELKRLKGLGSAANPKSKSRIKQLLSKKGAASGTLARPTISGGSIKSRFGASFIEGANPGVLSATINQVRANAPKQGRDVLEDMIGKSIVKPGSKITAPNAKTGILSSKGKEIFQDELVDGLVPLFDQATQKFGSPLNPGKVSLDQIISNSAIQSVKGNFFEGFARRISQNVIADSNVDALFDFDKSTKNIEDLKTLFGGTFSLPNEFKISSTTDNIASILGKSLAENPKSLTLESSVSKAKSAKGGVPNSVDALLTPGELVFGPEAVAQAGVSNLEKFNRTGDASSLGNFDLSGVGVVPGVGSGDTVSRVLEPGSFVIKKSSSEDSGLQQDVQKFAKGGSVGVRRFANGGSSGKGKGSRLAGIFQKIEGSALGLLGSFTLLSSIDFTSIESLTANIGGLVFAASQFLPVINSLTATSAANTAEEVANTASIAANTAVVQASTKAKAASSFTKQSVAGEGLPLNEEDLLTYGVPQGDFKTTKPKKSAFNQQVEDAKRPNNRSFSRKDRASNINAKRLAQGKSPLNFAKSKAFSLQGSFSPKNIATAFKGGVGLSIGTAIAASLVGPLADSIADGFGRAEKNGAVGFSQANGGAVAAGISGAGVGAAKGAAFGASVGSFAGPVGIAIGTVGGAIAGGVTGLFTSLDDQFKFEQFEKLESSARSFASALDSLSNNFDNAEKVERVITAQDGLFDQVVRTTSALENSEGSFVDFLRIIGTTASGMGGLSSRFGSLVISVANYATFLNTANSALARQATTFDKLSLTTDLLADAFSRVPGSAFIQGLLDGASGFIQGKSGQQVASERSSRVNNELVSAAAAKGIDEFITSVNSLDSGSLERAQTAFSGIAGEALKGLSDEEISKIDFNNLGFDELNDVLNKASGGSTKVTDALKSFNKTAALAAGKDTFSAIEGLSSDGLNAKLKDAVIVPIRNFNKSLSKDLSPEEALTSFSKSFISNLNRKVGDAGDFLEIDKSKFGNLDAIQAAIDKIIKNDPEKAKQLAEAFGISQGSLGQLNIVLDQFQEKSTNATASLFAVTGAQDKLNRILASVTSSVDGLASAFDELNDRIAGAVSDFSVNTSNIEAERSRIASGDNTVVARSRINPFENIAGRSDAELQSGLDRITTATGSSEAFADTTGIVSFSRDLPFLFKNVIDSLKNQNPGSNAGTFNASDILKEFSANSNFDQLPDVVKEQFEGLITSQVSGGRQGDIGLGELEKILTSEGADALRDAFLELGDKTRESYSKTINEIDAFTAKIIESSNAYVQINQQRQKAELAALDRRNSIEDRLNKFIASGADARVRAEDRLRAKLETVIQAGGAASVGGTDVLNADSLFNRKAALEEKRATQTAALEANPLQDNEPLVKELGNTVSALNATNQAIELLSEDVSSLEAVESELTRVQSARLSARQRSRVDAQRLADAKTPQERIQALNTIIRPALVAAAIRDGVQVSLSDAALFESDSERATAGIGITDPAEIERMRARNNANIEGQIAGEIDAAGGGRGVGRSFARGTYGAGSSAAGTTDEEKALFEQAKSFGDQQAKIITRLAAENSARLQTQQMEYRKEIDLTRAKLKEAGDAFKELRDKAIGNFVAAAKDPENVPRVFKEGELTTSNSSPTSSSSSSTSPDSNNPAPTASPDKATRESAGLIAEASQNLSQGANIFGENFSVAMQQFSLITQQMNQAADKLAALPELQIRLDANVGPVEVILNGASIISEFGQRVKSEILQAVGEKLTQMGLTGNPTSPIKDPSL